MTEMRFGFTGTREGATAIQLQMLGSIICSWKGQFHHGDCIGADAQAHAVALTLGFEMHIWPPTNEKNRAFCEGGIIHPAADYMVRNRFIVNNSDRMLATPKSFVEEFRGSGTWAAIRYAEKQGRPLKIIFPNGQVESRRWT